MTKSKSSHLPKHCLLINPELPDPKAWPSIFLSDAKVPKSILLFKRVCATGSKLITIRRSQKWIIVYILLFVVVIDRFYIEHCPLLSSRLTALACGSTWVTSFIARLKKNHPPKWSTYSAGMAGATWNCSRLGTSPVYTIQPCSMSLHAKPHT